MRKQIITGMSLEQIFSILGDISKKATKTMADCPCCGKPLGLTISVKGYAKCYHCGVYFANSEDYYNKMIAKKTSNGSEEESASVEKVNELRAKLGVISDLVNNQSYSFKNATEDELDLVYTLFSNVYILNGSEKLSVKDMNYLLNRGLTTEDIKKYGFFSMPKSNSMNLIVKELERLNKVDLLMKIPGFYYDGAINSWSYTYVDAIGIPIKDANDKIRAIQLRSNSLNSPIRYFWFSSAKYNSKVPDVNGRYNGSSPGSPMGIALADTADTLCIVEGVFKEIEITKKGNDTITMQGVYSFNNDDFVNMYQTLLGRGRNYKEVKIFFDSDLIHNANVIKAVNRLADRLSKCTNIPIKVALWDISKGKGIDDYIMNGHDFNDITYVEASDFGIMSNKLLSIIGNNTKKVTEKDVVSKITFEELLNLVN